MTTHKKLIDVALVARDAARLARLKRARSDAERDLLCRQAARILELAEEIRQEVTSGNAN